MSRCNTNRSGSIYVLTLFTVAAVGSMVLIGAAIRSGTSAKSTIIEEMGTNASGVVDASELALAHILSSDDWATSAQKGTIFSEFTLNGQRYKSVVLDADNLTTPTDSTTKYRVVVTSETGVAQETARFEVERSEFKYFEYLKSIGLDAYWPLYEPSGESKAEDREDGRHGVYLVPKNAGSDTNDQNGLVPVFNGSNDHVVTDYDSEYQDNVQGTISFWMKLNGTSNVTTYGIFGQRFRTNGMPAASLTCTAGSLFAYMDDAGNYTLSHSAQTPASTVRPGVWHHVAMSWGSAGLTIYVDGVEEARTADCTEYWDTQDGDPGKQPLMIGAGYIVSWLNQPLTGFDGSIARFAILANQLSASEIKELASVKPDLDEIRLIENTWARVYE